MAIQSLYGDEQFNPNFNSITQVFEATHKREWGAWERSPLMHRSFISFRYGGKNIEDFGLIAIFRDDRLNKNLYSEFDDSVTEYETLDGQFYWGTSLKANQLTFNLATDGITEDELNEFTMWFKPGTIRELILAEHPNRGIRARVSAPPQISMIPFEKPISFTLDSITYSTSTTLYKGDVVLSFVMDEPYWYAINNYLDNYYFDVNDKFGSMCNTRQGHDYYRVVLQDKDCLKVIAEDYIPHISAIVVNNMLLGDNKRVNLNYSIIAPDSVSQTNAEYNGVITAAIDRDDTSAVQEGIVATVTSDSGANLTSSSPLYLYYSGTAPSKPIIQFTLTPSINDNGYINLPANSYTDSTTPYNYLKIGTAEMRFTTPAIYTGYNQAIDIIRHCSLNTSIYDIEALLKVGVNEYYSRTFALMCLKMLVNVGTDAGIETSTMSINDLNIFIAAFKNKMQYFYLNNSGTQDNMSATFRFNTKTGEATGAFNIRTVEVTTVQNSITNNPVNLIEENVGDMLRSSFIVIDGRNHLGIDGFITASDCLEITTDCSELTNLSIEYKNMYY